MSSRPTSSSLPAPKAPSSDVSSSEEWLDALRRDEPKALQSLQRELTRGLKRAFAANRAVNLHLDDFVQESILRIRSRLSEFQFRSHFLTWSHAISVNVALGELRKSRWKDCSLEDLDDGVRHELEANITAEKRTSPEFTHELRELIASELTVRQKRAIYALLSDLPLDQIATLLGLKRNALYKVLHEARRRLRRGFENRGWKSSIIPPEEAP